MGMSINTNVAALTVLRQMNNTNGDMSKTLEQLSSGFKINSAADGK